MSTTNESAVNTKQVDLYEPAMCCSTGVCGPSVDEQLIVLREDLRRVESLGVSVTRHNLTSDPDAFVANTKIVGLMHALGDAALPALVVDGEVHIHGRYPTQEELAGLVGETKLSLPAPVVQSSGCGCAPGSSC